MAVTPLSPYDWLNQTYPVDERSDEFKIKNAFVRSEDESPYARYLREINEQLIPDITDAQGNVWVAPGQGYGFSHDESEGYQLHGGIGQTEEYTGPYADIYNKLKFTSDTGATYIPKVLADQIGFELNQHGGLHGWINGPGPVMLLASLFTAGAASGWGAGSTAASTGAGGAAANQLGLQQMAAAAGLPAGSAASDAFIASGGTIGSTAAGGLGTAGSLAEYFGYTTPEYVAANYGTSWWDIAKQWLPEAQKLLGISGDVQPGGSWNTAPAEAVTDTGVSAITAATAAPAIAATPTIEDVPPAPKPGAPDYKSLWESYAGWVDNVNRINEGAFADVRARLSAAGAAPDLIKMQTEHLESQRVEALEEFNRSSTFGLLEEGYNIAVHGKTNPYEGGLSPYAGAGKPELMNFYTELYGQPMRGAGPGGKIGTGGTPSTSGQSKANPWLDDSANVSLI